MPPETLTEPENKIICMCNLARPKTKMIQMGVQVFLGDLYYTIIHYSCVADNVAISVLHRAANMVMVGRFSLLVTV